MKVFFDLFVDTFCEHFFVALFVHTFCERFFGIFLLDPFKLILLDPNILFFKGLDLFSFVQFCIGAAIHIGCKIQCLPYAECQSNMLLGRKFLSES